MKLLLDPFGMFRLYFAWEATDYSRHFVASAPARLILAFPNGLDAASLTGAVVEAQSREEIGSAGRVRLVNVGLPHSTLTIYRRVDGPPDTTLSQLLADCLQDEA